MRYRTWRELHEKCSSEVAYRIDVIVFTNEVNDDDSESVTDWEFWYDDDHEVWKHPFECFFDDLDEAVKWCRCFDKNVARWTHTHGNGVRFDHVAIEIVEMEMEHTYSEFTPNNAVAVFDWMWGTNLEEWFFEDVAQRV